MANSVTVTVYLGTDPSIIDVMQKAADKAKLTRNEWIVKAIEEKLKRG